MAERNSSTLEEFGHQRLRGASSGPAIRSVNTQAVLNALRDKPGLSAAEVGQLVGIHPSTVARLMYALADAGLVVSVDDRTGNSAGRPRKLWSINPNWGLVIGLDVHPSELRGILVDLSGQVVATRTVSSDPALMAEALAPTVRDLAMSLAGDQPREKILGVGVGVSGILDPSAGVVRLSGALFQEPGRLAIDYPLGEKLQDLLPWPVALANDANLGALAVFRREVRRGRLRADSSLLYVLAVRSLWGFGGGIIVRGQLHHGSHGAAGEILHPRLLSEPLELGDLPKRALMGDCVAQQQAVRALEALLEHVVALALTLDADCLVLGGAFAALGESLTSRVAEMMRSTPGFGHYFFELAERGIATDPLWPDTVALGAAELVLDSLFREPSFQEVGPLVHVVQAGQGA